MAYIERKDCLTCCKVTQYINGKCSDCEHKRIRQENAAWEAQTIEEKLRDIHFRVKHLENTRIFY